MDKFLDAYNQPKLNQEVINHLMSTYNYLQWNCSSNKESLFKEATRIW
jgi:hypothetical protein